jgi:WhiB family redox-sensing transcriptional regulator
MATTTHTPHEQTAAGPVPVETAAGPVATRTGGGARRHRSRAALVPAAVDLSTLDFSLVVPGGGPEFAPAPLRRTGISSGSHLQEVPPVGSWAAQGACRHRTELFFPVRGQRPQAALDLCAQCPVVEPCLAYGLDHAAQLGVLGGMTVEERRRVRSATKAAIRAARGTDGYPLLAVLADLARHPVRTWGEIARGDADTVVQLAFELGAGWHALPPGRWEFDVELGDGPALRARLVERDVSMAFRIDDPAISGEHIDDPDPDDDTDETDDVGEDPGAATAEIEEQFAVG